MIVALVHLLLGLKSSLGSEDRFLRNLKEYTYTLEFQDLFENLDNWVVDVMPGISSGNNEIQHYSDSPDNVFLTKIDNQNVLVLRSLERKYGNYNYTSGKVYSKLPFGPYGFYNIKAKVPKDNCLFPAIWMLPLEERYQYGRSPSCGEMDIMESICKDKRAFYVAHYGGTYPNNDKSPDFPNNFFQVEINWDYPHYFGVEWQPEYMKFWLDARVVNGKVEGIEGARISSEEWYSLTNEGELRHKGAPFDVPFNLIMNLAVGGNWANSLNCCTSIPSQAEMHIYQVEVWK